LFFHERGYSSLAYPLFIEDISTSSDVFKFGILILDIISGRKFKLLRLPEQQVLSQWVHINNLVASYIFKITLDP